VSVLCVPPLEPSGQEWYSLGGEVVEFLTGLDSDGNQSKRFNGSIFGPGSLKGEPYRMSDEKVAAIYRAYEIYPPGHIYEGRRRFKRVGISWRKGTAKTEWAAQLCYAELHPEGPVRFDHWQSRDDGTVFPVGKPVRDPYIPMVAYNLDQAEELAYGALMVLCSEGPDAELFDVALERILVIDGGRPAGKAVPLSGSPNANDGARTTFQHFDEAVDLHTPVATPGGWREIGSLVVGDYVYDRFGKPVEVIGFSRTHVGRPCFRVTFNDGTSVVTDAGHLWKMTEWSNRPAGEQRVTTEQMFDRGVETGYGKRWRLPRANGFDGVTANLLIAPYLLGLWLGDGSSNHCAYIHSALDDYPHLSVELEHTAKQVEANLVRWLPVGLTGALRRMGALLGNKHIPDAYLFADRQQRLDLLAGLMDTDGHTTKGGNCTFVQGKRELCEQVALLVRSLGCEASITEQADPRSRTGSMFKVHFSPAFCPFRLPRKAKAADWRVRRSTSWPAVAMIEPVESVPVRCIAVDSDDHLFLAGRGLHLTHNTHRQELPRLVAAHDTMLGNIPKRPLEDPWTLETTTAGRPGGGSIAEATHKEAQLIEQGKIDDPELFYFHREAGPQHDLKTLEGRISAVAEATGPEGEYGPGQFRDIAKQWDRPRADTSYLERVWLNRWTRSDLQAYDPQKFEALGTAERIRPGAFVTAGFDGARFRDATAFVLTDIESGVQMPWAIWERPEDVEDWEVPIDEVNAACEDIFDKFDVWQLYADPPYYVETVAQWQSKHPDHVTEFWTNQRRRMGKAAKAYKEAIDTAVVTHTGDETLVRHVGNAGRVDTNLWDEENEGHKLWILGKIRPEVRFDACMAAVLSWQGRLDALAKNAQPSPENFIPYRLR
jgi:hypothetical protein